MAERVMIPSGHTTSLERPLAVIIMTCGPGPKYDVIATSCADLLLTD